MSSESYDIINVFRLGLGKLVCRVFATLLVFYVKILLFVK